MSRSRSKRTLDGQGLLSSSKYPEKCHFSLFITVTAVKNDSFYFLVRTEHLVFSPHFNNLSKSVLCRIVMKVVALVALLL